MKKKTVIVLVIIALLLSIGYALFSDRITINGTAKAKGGFDVEITQVTNPTCVGFSGSCAVGTAGSIATVSANKNTVNISVDKLTFPGAYVQFDIIVKNVGTIDAVLENITEKLNNVSQATSGTFNISPLKITYTSPGNLNSVLKAGEVDNTVTITVKVEWLSDSSTGEDSVDQTANFSIEIDYVQKTS